jgi:hypothetical protein
LKNNLDESNGKRLLNHFSPFCDDLALLFLLCL